MENIEKRTHVPVSQRELLKSRRVRPFELELADRIATSSVLPSLSVLERPNYDFSKVEKGPDFKETLQLFGNKEMAELVDGSAEFSETGKGYTRLDGTVDFKGKSYSTTRIVVSEPHQVQGLKTVPKYPSKLFSILLLKHENSRMASSDRSTLRQKTEKLIDKSIFGRKVAALTNLPDDDRLRINLNDYDSAIFGLWTNPVEIDLGVIYTDASLEVLHPDYVSSRRAMNYDLGMSMANHYSMITPEPLRTDKSRSEIVDEEHRRLERLGNDDSQSEKTTEQVRKIPGRTAWFDFETGNNITEHLRAA